MFKNRNQNTVLEATNSNNGNTKKTEDPSSSVSLIQPTNHALLKIPDVVASTSCMSVSVTCNYIVNENKIGTKENDLSRRTSRRMSIISTPNLNSSTSETNTAEKKSSKRVRKGNDIKCPICLVKLSQTATNSQVMSTKCGHIFCSGCITKVVREKKECPMCSSKLTLRGLRVIYLN